MTAIKGLLNEIRFEMLKVIILEAFLDSILLFLALLLVLSIFGMGVMLPLLLSAVTLIIDVLVRTRKISLKYIEDQNPEIREMLRTAADNKDEEGLMAHALFAEVIEKMRNVSGGSFLDIKEAGIKLAAMFLLSGILISLAFFNVNIQKFENPLAGLTGTLEDGLNGLWGNGTDVAGVNITNMDKDLYGDARIARLGSEDLAVTIQQNLNRIDFNKVSDADPNQIQPDDYPVEVSAQASEAYTAGLEDINDRKTAAEYSQQVKR